MWPLSVGSGLVSGVLQALARPLRRRRVGAKTVAERTGRDESGRTKVPPVAELVLFPTVRHQA